MLSGFDDDAYSLGFKQSPAKKRPKQIKTKPELLELNSCRRVNFKVNQWIKGNFADITHEIL